MSESNKTFKFMDFTLVTVVMVIGKEYGLDSHCTFIQTAILTTFMMLLLCLFVFFELALRYLPKITFYKIKIHNLNRDLPNIEMHYWEYPDKNRYDLSIWTILKQHCIKQPKWSLKPKLNFKTLHHCMNQMYINSYSFVKWFRQEQWVIFCLLLFD